MADMKSGLEMYQEAVWAVVENALIDCDIDRALRERVTFGILTKSEVLSISKVDDRDFQTDCFRYFGKEMRLRMQSFQYQLECLSKLIPSPVQAGAGGLVACQNSAPNGCEALPYVEKQVGYKLENVGKTIYHSDGTAFLIVTDGVRIGYMNLDICELPDTWFDSWESLLLDFYS